MLMTEGPLKAQAIIGSPRFDHWRISASVATAPTRYITADTDAEFLALLRAYRMHRGLARAHELIDLAAYRSGVPRSTAEGWLARADVCSFSWGDQFWVPMFQFQQTSLVPLIHVQSVCQELIPAFDGWEIAKWFVDTNSLLHGQRPIEVVDVKPMLVLQAARADRYIAKGFGA